MQCMEFCLILTKLNESTDFVRSLTTYLTGSFPSNLNAHMHDDKLKYFLVKNETRVCLRF